MKAETSLQADVGLILTSPHVTLEAGIFRNQIQNYIYAQRLRSVAGGDSIRSLDEPVPTYQYGQNSARLLGGELSMDIHPHPFDWLHFENTFSMVRGQNLDQPDSARYLPFMPPARFQSELRVNRKKVGRRLSNGFAKLSLDHYFEQNQYLQENRSETATPGYTLIHAGIGSEVIDSQGHKKITVYLLANNLFDVAYQSHLSRLKYNPINPATGRRGIYNMGRTISLKVIVPLVFAR
ncbi:MAG: TonB-dependent receptor [Spirosoma sp.]|nr:TonB-dependent receptor [Spirosoma sp.]